MMSSTAIFQFLCSSFFFFFKIGTTMIDKKTTALSVAGSLMLMASACSLAGAAADGHAPIGVMGDHLHKQGEWMFSYRYMHMDMDKNRDGKDTVSIADIHQEFMVAPMDMSMDMHMLGAMYAPSDAVTMMLMVPYVELDMRHETRMGQRFTTSAKGIGDVKLSGLIRLYQQDKHSVHLNMGLSFPTGDIDRKDETAMSNGNEVQLPYPMQLGSGTYDVLPGVTYLGYGKTSPLSWGTQLMANIRTGDNDRGYTLGDQYQLTGWLANSIQHNLSASVRMTYLHRENISGADEDLNPMMVQTARTDLQGLDQVDLAIGTNYVMPSGHRFAAELSYPVFQDVDGPQLVKSVAFTVGWQYAL